MGEGGGPAFSNYSSRSPPRAQCVWFRDTARFGDDDMLHYVYIFPPFDGTFKVFRVYFMPCDLMTPRYVLREHLLDAALDCVADYMATAAASDIASQRNWKLKMVLIGCHVM